MALLNRLIGQNMTPEEKALGKLPVHQCIAAWGEYLRPTSPWTWQMLVERFGLTPSEEVSLQEWFVAAGGGGFTLEELEQILELGEAGYSSEAEIRARLGLEDPGSSSANFSNR